MNEPVIIGDCTLYFGDSLEIMPTLAPGIVDAVVMDPPYCSGGFSESGKRQAKGQGLRSETIRDVGWFVNDNMTTGGLVWLLRSVAVVANFLMRDGASLCAFTDWRMVPHLAPAMESSGLRYQNMLVWNKGNMGLGFGFRPQHEIILHFVRGVGKFHDKCTGNVINASRVHCSNKLHQTEKPEDLIEKIVCVTSPVGGLVVDAFMGSGTTGIACMNTGRRFIGIEKDPDIFATAVDRIRKAYAERPRLLEAV